MKDKTLYDKDSIQSLSPREHVRLRAGMYIGATKDPTQLVIEIFSNALDEHNLGHGNLIEVCVDTKTGMCQVNDNGQGFPVNEKRDDGKTVLQASFPLYRSWRFSLRSPCRILLPSGIAGSIIAEHAAAAKFSRAEPLCIGSATPVHRNEGFSAARS